MKVDRKHDEIYLEEDRKRNPKETFKFMFGIAGDHLRQYDSPRILDIGCATGDLLYYLRSQLPQAILTGVDILPELIERAKQEVDGVEFKVANIADRSFSMNKKFDAVFMSGVHSIFDDLSPWLDNIISLLEPGGRAYIFGIFNPEDIDIIIRSRSSANYDSDVWETGWNYFSRKSITRYLSGRKIKGSCFYDFQIGIDIPKNKKDPLRTWTFKYADGTRGIVNGLQLVHQGALLEIRG